jgi:RNA polymerase sigma-70 factor (ECF subfamily)
LSVWRSFFVGARLGRFSLDRSGDLWRLLVAITMHKLFRQVRHHSTARRSIDVEQSLDRTAEDEYVVAVTKREPTPEEAIALAEELEAVILELDVFARRVLELRLQGEHIKDIATETGRSERTVRRSLELIRQRLTKRLGHDVRG